VLPSEGGGAPAGTEGTPAKGQERGLEWTILNPLEGFVVKFKIAVYAGVLVALPYLLFQVCAFIFPGLLPHERRAALFLLVGCGGLALAGVAVAYWVVFPMLLPYLTSWAPPGVKLQLRMNETVSIILKGLAGFAIAFQFPMIVITLVYIGILHPDVLRKQRRIAVIIMAVVAAVFTPPDPISMLVMMVPLLALYEVSIWASYLVLWRRARQAEEAAAPGAGEAAPETRQIE
jgi:sec-independent protein translocase protein TatC